MNNQKNVLDPESLEMSILDNVKALSHAIDALIKQQISIMSIRAKLRNELCVFKKEYPKSMYDDLLHAMIMDDALPLEEILLAFDLNEPRFKREIERITKEKRK